MEKIMNISTFTDDEKAYQKKFSSLLEESKILEKSFFVSCAVCKAMIKHDQITQDNFHVALYVLLCATCASRARTPGVNNTISCDWCGNDFLLRSKLKRCVKTGCNRKFCTICVREIRKIGKENKVKGSCFCVFCEPRLIKEDIAIGCAVFQGVIDQTAPTDIEQMFATFKEQECVICSDNEAKISFVPCRHTCLCSTCLPRFKEKFLLCPICQGQYEDAISI